MVYPEAEYGFTDKQLLLRCLTIAELSEVELSVADLSCEDSGEIV